MKFKIIPYTVFGYKLYTKFNFKFIFNSLILFLYFSNMGVDYDKNKILKLIISNRFKIKIKILNIVQKKKLEKYTFK
jgi:hypothetical protein